MTPQTIHVVGGGLVGTLAAIVVAQRGFKVALHERRRDMRRPGMRRVDIPAGRSINLAVTARGLKALEEVGLKERILDLAVPMRGRMLHDTQGQTTFVPYGQKESEVINSVSRGSLNKVLLEKAGSYQNVEIACNHRCVAYDLDASTLTFVNDETGQTETVPANVVIGADGAWSVIRKTMRENVKDFNYSQELLEHGYKELVIPPAADGGFRLEKNALHIWPRKSFMLIALPNLDGSFTCTLFFANWGEESFATLQTEREVLAFFSRAFPDAVPLMPTLAKDFFSNPTGSMVTVKCKPWHVDGKVLLLGDAAHAIVPFFGQGMNCGFEDCSALGELMDDAVSWNELFEKLESRRKPNADAIAEMAVENFVEMRDTVADPKFQLKKQIGFELERWYPDQFIPRYALVVFHPEIPYARARQRSEIQDKILEELCVGVSSLEQVDWGKADQLIRRSALFPNSSQDERL
jgi:kynurenine 3-monooxygenase